MTRKILLLIIVLLSANNVQAGILKYLVVKTTNGDFYSFGLSDEPIITFANQLMQITSKSDSHSFEISGVKEYAFSEYAFSDTNVTGVEDVQANKLRIYNNANGKVVIEGIQPNSTVRVFSVDGKEQKSNISMADDKACLDLNSLLQGVYIVSINNKSFKIYKK